MKPSLRQQFERLALRLAELDATLADGAVAVDMKRFRELTREQLGNGVRGKYFNAFTRGSNVVVLKPELRQ